MSCPKKIREFVIIQSMTNTSGLPTHIAIIPDGNRRWARERGLPSIEGHRKGANAVYDITQEAWKMGISCMTLWGFSTENWNRNVAEVSLIMGLFEEQIDRSLRLAKKHRARFIHLGRKDRISENLKNKLSQAESETKDFNERYLSVAIDYGGKDEVLRAINTMTSEGIDMHGLDNATFEKYLDTSQLPNPYPDLIIRTGGEQRLSGFMSWQSGYAEMMFVNKLLPEFTVEDFTQCIEEYQNRQRRFGK